MDDRIRHELAERVKELTALHGTARILQHAHRPTDELMAGVLALVPPSMQHPADTAARIRFGERAWATDGFHAGADLLSVDFTTRGGTGGIDIAYLESHPPAARGPFLAEECDLAESLAEMLRAHFEHVLADAALRSAYDDLEDQVAARTSELRRLAAELCLTEARERRRIAEGLHDHIGQALAIIKRRVDRLRGDAVFSGLEYGLDEVGDLIDRTIRYTRELTGEISPPVLYELGLADGLDWLAEWCGDKLGLAVGFSVRGEVPPLRDEQKVMLFNSARELLNNVQKHAGVTAAELTLSAGHGVVEVGVADAGAGFDPSRQGRPDDGGHFGLFSIRERMRQLGGRTTVETAPGAGTRIVLSIPVEWGTS
jgi:signal transduction histidine kinase